jgi:hypothetical protein
MPAMATSNPCRAPERGERYPKGGASEGIPILKTPAPWILPMAVAGLKCETARAFSEGTHAPAASTATQAHASTVLKVAGAQR